MLDLHNPRTTPVNRRAPTWVRYFAGLLIGDNKRASPVPAVLFTRPLR